MQLGHFVVNECKRWNHIPMQQVHGVDKSLRSFWILGVRIIVHECLLWHTVSDTNYSLTAMAQDWTVSPQCVNSEPYYSQAVPVRSNQWGIRVRLPDNAVLCSWTLASLPVLEWVAEASAQCREGRVQWQPSNLHHSSASLRHALLLSQLYPVMSTGTHSSSSSLFSKFLITFHWHQTTANWSLLPNAPPPHLLLLLDSNPSFLPQCSLPRCSPPKALTCLLPCLVSISYLLLQSLFDFSMTFLLQHTVYSI